MMPLKHKGIRSIVPFCCCFKRDETKKKEPLKVNSKSWSLLKDTLVETNKNQENEKNEHEESMTKMDGIFDKIIEKS